MKALKRCVIALIILILGLFYLKYQLDCSNMHLGGTGSSTPDYCKPYQPKPIQRTEEEKRMYQEEFAKDNEFTCRHEYRPELSPETQQLYHYALYHDLHNMWAGKKNDAVWQNAAIYYRIAAANGDYKANTRLQYLLSTGRVGLEERAETLEVHELNKKLAESLLATAYYNLKGHLDSKYGVETLEKDTGWDLLHKAAQLGNREAQYALGELIRSLNDDDTEELRMELTKKLFQCASEQGEPNASVYLGIMHQDNEDYSNAVLAYHQGAKNGDAMSARLLMKAFNKNVSPRDDLKVMPDIERAKRYEMIKTYLSRHEHLQPKVPDLDEIVPLPPAKLPPWDGKIAFQRWFEGPSPEKPSDELMQKLAKQAGLDWQTGLPLKK